MFKRMLPLLAVLSCGLCTCLLDEPISVAQGQEVKAPDWKHGLVFRVRKWDQEEFDEKTTRYGTEIFVDRNGNNAVYISYTGSLAAAPAASLLGGRDAKAPKWLHGLKLKCRKAGQKDFDNAPQFGIEVFKDENSNNLIYVCQTGDIAVVKAPEGVAPADKAKKPTWLHAMELRCRRGGELDFGPNTPRFGIEVFKDENVGTLVYITETGALAVAPPTTLVSGTRDPKWLHGLEFRVRKAGMDNFDPKTPNFGAEIYRDENAGNLMYITEKGYLAVSPAAGGGGTDTKPPKWLAGMELKVRRHDEKEFTKDTKRFGAEIFHDPNTNHTVYVCETASLAVAPVK
jgi:hypothetical protein